MQADSLIQQLSELADPKIAAHAKGFFKTAPGEYGHGDIFWGIRVPVLRKLVKAHIDMPLNQVKRLLTSPVHEIRLMALLLMVQQYSQGNDGQKQAIFACYLEHTHYINNWDLVDSSAHWIIGPHLQQQDRSLLYQWAASPLLWERRMAIMATLHFIKVGEYRDTLQIAELLLHDKQDLIHKAVGWMLREVGKRHKPTELDFLTRFYQQMPRTMLRYAIEKFPEPERQAFLTNQITSTTKHISTN